MNRCALILLLALISIGASGQAAPAHPQATVRVGLWTLWHDKEISLAPAANSLATLRLCPSCTPAQLIRPIHIQAAGNALRSSVAQSATSLYVAGPVVLAAHGESLTLDHSVRMTARSGELVLAVTLPIEFYVERVVASESSPAEGSESLQALAIAVRSFALHQPHGHAGYDLCDSTHCQLLHWANSPSRRAAAHAATLATAGETLWYHGRRASAWFHQDCGGRTASPSEAWPSSLPPGEFASKPMPWLISRTDPYCTVKGPRQWSTTLSLTDLTAALRLDGLVRPGWTTLTVIRRGESGRAVLLRIGATDVSAEDFRLAIGRSLGWSKILSTWFEVSSQNSAQGPQFLFHGHGSGHGVGLCQAGAAAMSALGKTSGEILGQYFPGAVPADEATGQAWQTFHAPGFTLQSLARSDSAYLPQLEQALAEAESRSGLHPPAPIAIRAFSSTASFRNLTLAPGWQAAFTEGNLIAAQPLATLAARHLLLAVLRHEFLHVLVEAQAAPATPLWLREGLVELWSGPQDTATSKTPSNPPSGTPLEEIDRDLAHADSEAKSQAAHRAAAWYAQRLIDRRGRNQVLDWLHSGLPNTSLADPR